MDIAKDEITLVNEYDSVLAKEGRIRAEEVRAVTVTAIADTRVLKLTIPESIRQQLGLEIERRTRAELADGTLIECGITEGVRVRWRDRETLVQARVVPDGNDIQIGRISMDSMDLMVDSASGRLAGVHGDKEIGYLIGIT